MEEFDDNIIEYPGTEEEEEAAKSSELLAPEEAPPPERPIPTRWKMLHIILIIAFLLPTYAYFFQGGRGNYAPQFALTRSIIERGRLDVGGYPTGADIIHHNGKLFSSKAPGNALIAVPAFFVFFNTLPLLDLAEWLVEHLTVYLTTICTVSLFTVLTAILLYLVMMKITRNPLTALMSALGYGLATLAFPYATMFFTHQTSSFLCFMGFFLVFSMTARDEQRPRVWLLILAGFISGMAVVTEHGTLLIIVLLTLYAFWRLEKKLMVFWFILGGLLAAGVLMGYNYFAYGDPFFVSYKAYAVSENSAFSAHQKGFMGITYPKLDVLYRITLHPQRGLFYINPFLITMFPGLLFLWFNKQYRKETILVLATIVVYFAFNASYGDCIIYWGGGACAGPRIIVPMIPFAMIAVGMFFHRIKILFPVLFIPSLLIMLMTASVNPILDYKYYNPLLQLLVPSFLDGDFSIHTYGIFNNTSMTGDTVAFNLGIIAGLKGTWSLLPLMALWMVLLWCMLSHLVKKGFLSALAHYVIYIIFFMVFATSVCYPLVHQHHTKRFQITDEERGLIGYYYKGEKFRGNPDFIQRDPQVNFPWKKYEDQPLEPPFCIRWEGQLVVPQSGTYNFATESDDGSWLYIDGMLVVDNGGRHATRLMQASKRLTKGKHDITLKFVNNAGSGNIRLFWTPPGKSRQIISTQYLVPR